MRWDRKRSVFNPVTPRDLKDVLITAPAYSALTRGKSPDAGEDESPRRLSGPYSVSGH